MNKKLSKRKLTNFQFSRQTRGTLSRLKRRTGWTQTRVVVEALAHAERTNAFSGTPNLQSITGTQPKKGGVK